MKKKSNFKLFKVMIFLSKTQIQPLYFLPYF